MTDRINSLTVALDADYRDATAEELDKIILAIEQIKGVLVVKKGPVADPMRFVEAGRMRLDLAQQVYDLISKYEHKPK